MTKERTSGPLLGMLVGALMGALGGACFAGVELSVLLWAGYAAPDPYAGRYALALYIVVAATVGGGVGATGLWGPAWSVAAASVWAGLLVSGKLAAMAIESGAPGWFGMFLAAGGMFLVGQVGGRLPGLPANLMQAGAATLFLFVALAFPVNLHLLAGAGDGLAVLVDGLVLLGAVALGCLVAVVSGERPPILALLLGNALAWGAAWPKLSQDAHESWPVAGKGGRPVVLIAIEGFRADRMPAMGHHNNTTPNIDAFAAHGLFYRQAMSTAPWNVPAIATLLTGRHPENHGAGLNDGRSNHNGPLRTDVDTLATRLAGDGYATMAVSGDPWLQNYWFDRGFGRWDGVPPEGPLPLLVHPWVMLTGDPLLWSLRRSADEVTEAALESVRQQKRGGWFLFVHYMDAVPPLSFTEEDARGIGGVRTHPADSYDAALHRVDRAVGKLLRALPEGAVVAIVGTHGAELQEKRPRASMMPVRALSGHGLHQELVHVPVIFGGLGRDFTDQPVSTIDVAPTLLRAAGASALEGADGRSLPREGVHTLHASTIRWGREQQAVRRGPHKLIVAADGTWRLFDLSTDPREALPIRPGDPQADQLKRSLGAELGLPGRGARWDNRESASRRLGAWLMRMQNTRR